MVTGASARGESGEQSIDPCIDFAGGRAMSSRRNRDLVRSAANAGVGAAARMVRAWQQQVLTSTP